MSKEVNLKFWAAIYRGLGNQNRLKILKFVFENDSLSVGDLADLLKISFKNTSRNLKILVDLGLLEFEGRKDRVYYSLNSKLRGEFKKIIDTTFDFTD